MWIDDPVYKITLIFIWEMVYFCDFIPMISSIIIPSEWEMVYSTRKCITLRFSDFRPTSMGFELYKKLVTPGFYGAKKDMVSPER